MAALTMLDTHSIRGNGVLLETIARTNLSPTTTVNKGFVPPSYAIAATFVIDITITGTTPLFDFTLKGVNVTGSPTAATAPDTADMYLIGAGFGAGITQLTTDTTHAKVTIHVNPYAPIDITGSATADCVYSVNTFLQPVMGYTYVMDGTTGDEDYNGTITVYWHSQMAFG